MMKPFVIAILLACACLAAAEEVEKPEALKLGADGILTELELGVSPAERNVKIIKMYVDYVVTSLQSLKNNVAPPRELVPFLNRKNLRTLLENANAEMEIYKAEPSLNEKTRKDEMAELNASIHRIEGLLKLDAELAAKVKKEKQVAAPVAPKVRYLTQEEQAAVDAMLARFLKSLSEEKYLDLVKSDMDFKATIKADEFPKLADHIRTIAPDLSAIIKGVRASHVNWVIRLDGKSAVLILPKSEWSNAKNKYKRLELELGEDRAWRVYDTDDSAPSEKFEGMPLK